MTLKGHYAVIYTHSVSKHMRLSEPTTKIWMKIDAYYQRRRCSPMTLDSGNIRFMRIFPGGFLGDEALNDNRVNENVDFHGFRTLPIWHLRKWGQRYYIILFIPLSPFHWPQNTWPWMTLNDLNGHFTLNFHYYELPLRNYLLLIYCRVCLHYTCD